MFLQRAKEGRNEFWQYLVTIFAVIAAYVLGQIPLTGLMFKKMAELDLSQAEFMEIAEKVDLAALDIDLNVGLVLLLLSFVAAFFMLWLMIAKVHKKPFNATLTARPKLDWSRVFFGFALWFGLTIVGEVIGYFLEPDNYVFQLDWARFLPLLLIALLILPIQTSFEEVFMRGYLLQGISLISKHRWIPLVITSLFFGLLHSANPEIEKFGYAMMMPYYIGVGLFLGILTLLDDGLELALGIHAATNIYGAIGVTFEGSALSTPAIFSLKEVQVDYMLVYFFIMAALFFFIAMRKYKWSNWQKIYGKTDLEQA